FPRSCVSRPPLRATARFGLRCRPILPERKDSFMSMRMQFLGLLLVSWLLAGPTGSLIAQEAAKKQDAAKWLRFYAIFRADGQLLDLDAAQSGVTCPYLLQQTHKTITQARPVPTPCDFITNLQRLEPHSNQTE